MKKIRVLIMAAVMLIATALSVSAADRTSFDYENQKQLLINLGVINENDIADDTEAVSRADFVAYAARLIAMPENPDISEEYFVDVDSSFWGAKLINSFAQSGYISVGADRLFEPGEKITAPQAYKIIECILGYDAAAQAKGGYPTGYSVVAKNIGLPTVGTEGYLTVRDMVSLLADAGEVPFFEVESIGNNRVTYTDDNDNTIFYIYHNLRTAEGFVSSADGMSFGTSGAGEDEICVDGVLYCASEINYPGGYLGREVKILFKDNGSAKGSVYFAAVSSDEHNFEIDAKKLDSLDSNYRLTYYTDDNFTKKSGETLPRSVTVNYNGAVVTTDIRNYFNNIENGYVLLCDADMDGKWEYALIKDYRDCVVGFTDNAQSVIYDKRSGVSYELDDIKHARIYNAKHERVNLASVAAGTVVSVAHCGDYIEVVTGSQSISGAIESIGENGGRVYVTVDGTEYCVNKAYETEFANNARVGDSCTFLINAYSEISYVTVGAAQYGFGYLIGLQTKGALDTKVQAKIFGQDGAMHIYDFRDRVKIDGKQLDKDADITNALSEGNKVKIQLIRYKADENSVISDIDTAELGEGNIYNSLTESIQVDDSSSSPDVQRGFTQGGGITRVGMANLFNANTVIFWVPSDSVIESGSYDDSQFRVLPQSKFIADIGYTIKAYKTNASHIYQDAAVVYDDGSVPYDSNTNIMLVSKVTNGLNSDGVSAKRITGMRGGAEVSLCVASGFSGTMPDKGDTIAIGTDSRGDINNIVMVYDYSKGGTPTSQGGKWQSDSRFVDSTNFSQKFNCTFGYAVAKDGTAISLSASGSEDVTDYDEVIETKSYKVTVFDGSGREGRVYGGSVADIKDAHSVGAANASRVIVHYRYITVKEIIVYK